MRWSCWSQSMTWAKTSLKVTALPPRVGWYPGCSRPAAHRTIIAAAAPCLAGLPCFAASQVRQFAVCGIVFTLRCTLTPCRRYLHEPTNTGYRGAREPYPGGTARDRTACELDHVRTTPGRSREPKLHASHLRSRQARNYVPLART